MSSEVNWRMDFRFPVGHAVLEVVGVVAGGWLAGRAGMSAGCAMIKLEDSLRMASLRG